MTDRTGMYVTLIIYILTFVSCSQGMENEPFENTGQSDSDTVGNTGLRYLALGDSYTIGQNVTQAERWPVILVNDLNRINIKVKNPEIIATTGWTTANLLSSISNYNPSQSFEMVSLLIGVNNQFQGQSIETYKKEFIQLLAKSIAFAGGKRDKVFVVSIPDWGASDYAANYDRGQIGKDIDRFNAVAQSECEKEQILFINITAISRLALGNPSMLANDGLHFSGKMHQLWVDAILPQIRGKILK